MINGELYAQGIVGYWQTYTASDSTHGYIMRMTVSTVDIQYSHNTLGVFPLRKAHVLPFQYKSITARFYPLSLVLSGYYNLADGKLDNQGAIGNWWTWTANSGGSTHAYILRLVDDGLNSQFSSNKMFAFALRRGKPLSLLTLCCVYSDFLPILRA